MKTCVNCGRESKKLYKDILCENCKSTFPFDEEELEHVIKVFQKVRRQNPAFTMRGNSQ